MEGYKSIIKECSKHLTAKERIAVKDTTDAISIDAYTSENGDLIIEPDFFAVISIHNENAKADSNGNRRTDYESYVIVAKDGQKYVTSSQALWASFTDIYDEMEENGDGEEYSIRIYRAPSKNYKGKDFLTCSIR